MVAQGLVTRASHGGAAVAPGRRGQHRVADRLFGRERMTRRPCSAGAIPHIDAGRVGVQWLVVACLEPGRLIRTMPQARG